MYQHDARLTDTSDAGSMGTRDLRPSLLPVQGSLLSTLLVLQGRRTGRSKCCFPRGGPSLQGRSAWSISTSTAPSSFLLDSPTTSTGSCSFPSAFCSTFSGQRNTPVAACHKRPVAFIAADQASGSTQTEEVCSNQSGAQQFLQPSQRLAVGI